MKFEHRATATAGVLVIAAAIGAPSRPTIPLFDAATITGRCENELANARTTKKAIESKKDAGVFADWNWLSMRVADFGYPVYLLQSVATDKATRDAAQACLEKLLPFETEMAQSVPLYRRVRAVKPRDAIDQTFKQDLIEKFEDGGATLPPDKRKRAQEIADELERLSLQFSKNVNEDPTTVVLAPAEATGMPEAWLAARKRDANGNLVLGLDYPTVVPFMQNATSEAARRKVWMAKNRQGGEQNLPLLDRALKLRHELAQLHGMPDFATYAVKRRMAQTPAVVNEFLGKVQAAVDEVEARELAELRADKAKFTGTDPASPMLYRWDVAFHQERVRRTRFQIDQEVLRAYFPTDKSVLYTLKLAERLYGITFVERKVPVWHEDVQYFDVFERALGKSATGRTGAFIGGVYLDLYPREGKYSHARAFPVRPGSTLAQRTPISVLVTNFNRKGLNHDELETLLREFGHVLHGVLSKTRYVDQSGTSVKRDFVEAPSQMFEEWGRREEALRLFAEICPECPRLTSAQIEQLDSSRKYGQGILYARQREYAAYDMKLHIGAPPAAMATWAELEGRTRLGHVDGSLFPASFGHLMSGYAAGYYGYMWSQVLALDMLSAFDGKLMSAEVGRRYRQTILASGGQRHPQALVEAFLGRKPTSDAFYAEITGRR
ncbi:MAG TPA: M3 family metallopeptidase [Burkholderiaceae bacterium]|nr:M3 family metallopeptidase [Burkholderiaceae bacterium]